MVSELGPRAWGYEVHAMVPSFMKPEAIEVERYQGGRQRVEVHWR